MPKPDRLGSEFANAITEQLQPLAVEVASLTLWEGNPRQGDVGALSESLRLFGQTKPIIVQKSTMKVIGGNHTLRAAKALGWKEIAANVVDVDEPTAKAIALADNRLADLGDYDEKLLAKMLEDVAKAGMLDGTGYDEDDLDDLLDKVNKTTTKYGEGDPDAHHAIADEPWVKPGQLFQMDKHRIICGGQPKDFIRLLDGETPDMLIVTPNSTRFKIEPEIRNMLNNVPEQFWFRPQDYGVDGLGEGSWLVWDKMADSMDAKFGPTFEIIWSKQPHQEKIYRSSFVGAADGEKHGGPDFTERPTSLFMDLYERYSGFEGIIFDPYALGATALLAAEKSGRKYRGAKESPAFVQALLEKWTSYTGASPVLVEEPE
jgi:hypothetical protein